MDDNITASDSKPRRSAAQMVRWLQIGVVLAVISSLVVVGVAVVLRQALPPLSDDALVQAEDRWRTARLRDYDIEIEVQGAQPAIYRVEVRDHEPVSASRDGKPLTQQRTWNTWTVPGMFDTLASDVAALSTDKNLVARCQFAAETGIPERYQRIEMGTGQQVSWEVRHFEVYK